MHSNMGGDIFDIDKKIRLANGMTVDFLDPTKTQRPVIKSTTLAVDEPILGQYLCASAFAIWGWI